MLNRLFASLLLLAVIAFTCVAQQEKTESTKPGEIVARLVGDVADTESVVSNAWVAEWLKQVGKLPQIEPKTSNVNGKEVVIDESLFYFSRYGSPLAYARAVIDLGVDDGEFLSRVLKMLKPDGLFVIYNFCPPKAAIDKPYIPWADGESPFSKADFVAAGFEVLHLDVVDNAEARRLAHALSWDGPGGMTLETDLFAWYTIVRKKAKTESENP